MFKTPLSSTITFGLAFFIIGVVMFYSGYCKGYMNGEREGLISGTATGKIVPFGTGKSISFTDINGQHRGFSLNQTEKHFLLYLKFEQYEKEENSLKLSPEPVLEKN